ncbi:MAG: glycine zipper domain-containing protein [Planctomycetaceae bacterium]
MNLKSLILSGLVPGVLALTGCASTGNYHTTRGAAIGTGLGTVAGAIIGSQTGNAGEGALIGAAAGALGGGLIGNAEDAREERDVAIAQAAYQQQMNNALTNNDVILMSQSQLSEQVIISSIQSRGGRFDLSPQGLVMLKQSGVTDGVITYMQTNGQAVDAASPTVITAAPRVVTAPPVVVVEPAPFYPPPRAGFVFHFGDGHHRHHRGHWHH